MSSASHDLLSKIFLEVSALSSGEREEYLARACGSHDGLRREVESLLRHARDAPAILDRGAVDLQALVDADLLPGRIGPYELMERIGEGGMGVVYRARREKPFLRQVALKLIKPGLETRSVLARFDAERQLLALLDHPGIARVYDAGILSQGRPYFAMEYVEGPAVTAFCDENRLAVPARLDLFLAVCDAVQHAHRNGVIHRDLKPSNVLVTRLDGKPVPKIIDFGIAKALAGEGPSGGTLTEAGQFVGTPEYISPEQADPFGPPVDIRSDVYSLGALLYELLTGEPPLAGEALRGRDIESIRRIIRDNDPPAPGIRVVARGREADDVAGVRGTTPPGLTRSLRGDLDCIVMKALEKDRARRYGSVGDLAADLRRFMSHDPIEARPAGALYRLGRLARKHPTASVIAATLLPLLLGFAVVVALQARRLAHERDLAEDLASFLVRSYEMPQFIAGRHARPGTGDILARSARLIDSDLAGRPLLRARLSHSLGSALRSVGDLENAVVVLEKGRALLAENLGPRHEEALAAAVDLAQAYGEQGRYAAAERLMLEALHVQREALGSGHPSTLRTLTALGVLRRGAGRLDEAAALLRESMEGSVAALGKDHPGTLLSAGLLASVLLDLDAVDEAGAILSDTLPRMKEDHPERPFALYNAACVHARQGDREWALYFFRRAIDAGFHIDFFGDRHIRSLHEDPEFVALAKRARMKDRLVMGRVERLGRRFRDQGRYEEAEALYRHVLEEAPGSVLDRYLPFMGELGRTYLEQGRPREAARVFQDYAGALQARYGENDERVGVTWYAVMQAQVALGSTSGALEALERAEAIFPRIKNASYGRLWGPYLTACRAALAGDREAALRHLSRAVDDGFPHVDLLREEMLLDGIRDDPEFRALLEKLGRRYDYP